MADNSTPKNRLIEPTHIEENWTIIHLPNGDKLKAKHIVLGVFQTLDEKDKPMFLEDGTPMYSISFSNPVVGIIPKNDIVTRKN